MALHRGWRPGRPWPAAPSGPADGASRAWSSWARRPRNSPRGPHTPTAWLRAGPELAGPGPAPTAHTRACANVVDAACGLRCPAPRCLPALGSIGGARLTRCGRERSTRQHGRQQPASSRPVGPPYCCRSPRRLGLGCPLRLPGCRRASAPKGRACLLGCRGRAAAGRRAQTVAGRGDRSDRPCARHRRGPPPRRAITVPRPRRPPDPRPRRAGRPSGSPTRRPSGQPAGAGRRRPRCRPQPYWGRAGPRPSAATTGSGQLGGLGLHFALVCRRRIRRQQRGTGRRCRDLAPASPGPGSAHTP